ncbi:hypothetical protein T440DRAFT_146429 [Plenodomus tracheiphilus IPT5]|uniref:C2H2-type domain-containing protein n=1 Tax=Plenodomus tracheiphilus IPT5 TaxID=1408161 RepID=A0A6A7B340_9PLEO|nr:hypothetical protein T440DRAFT_146429 [Plenodomus tracheiphilus IPT5]
MSTSEGFQWGESQHTSLTLWDIDREFQQAHKAYEQWLARHRRTRPVWTCFGFRTQEDAVERALNLGRQVQRLMENGKKRFGARFEQGDSRCHTILSAQLVRLQYEVRQPLYDSALSPTPATIPHDEIIKTARSIRRTCLTALREQYARFQSPTSTPILPPPRFKVEFCPFADQLRHNLKDTKSSNLRTKKLKSTNRSDDREVCLHCDACISVTAHSGLPDYRSILFVSHIALDSRATDDRATFACKSCYKTFDDSYAFLDHVFQNQIGSERSCLKRASGIWDIKERFMDSDPSLVEQCLKNCLRRELTRVRTLKMMKSQIKVCEKEIHSAQADGQDFRSISTNSTTSRYLFSS